MRTRTPNCPIASEARPEPPESDTFRRQGIVNAITVETRQIETRKCGPLDEVEDEVGDDLPQRINLGDHMHRREHPSLSPRHHVHITLDVMHRHDGSDLRRARILSSGGGRRPSGPLWRQ
jgi:hypothetical protein